MPVMRCSPYNAKHVRHEADPELLCLVITILLDPLRFFLILPQMFYYRMLHDTSLHTHPHSHTP